MDAPTRTFQVTHARVLKIAAPMTLANLTTPLLGVIGTAVIGQLGQAHLLGAVAISAVVFDCIFWLFGFLRMGASPSVTEAARTYFYMRIWSAPFTLANYAVLGWLIGQARTNFALTLQV